MSSSSLPGHAPQASQAADASSSSTTPKGYPRDPTPRPVSKGANTAELRIESGLEVIVRLVRATIDGSAAVPPFVEWWAFDGKDDLPGRDSISMNYPISQREAERLKPWIDPDTGLGDTIWVTFSRFVGSDQKHTATMIDREKTKKEPETS